MGVQEEDGADEHGVGVQEEEGLMSMGGCARRGGGC